MKREGRQHGMVRSCPMPPPGFNPRPKSRFSFDSPTTAGLFIRVPSKPTNHSKFTGKCKKPRCNSCHALPPCKSRDKSKGTQKFKSHDASSHSRLNFNGFSAAAILDHIDNIHAPLDEVDYYNCVIWDGDFEDDYQNSLIWDSGSPSTRDILDDCVQEMDHDDDADTSYCDVGFLLDQVEGKEDWCLVTEL